MKTGIHTSQAIHNRHRKLPFEKFLSKAARDKLASAGKMAAGKFALVQRAGRPGDLADLICSDDQVHGRAAPASSNNGGFHNGN